MNDRPRPSPPSIFSRCTGTVAALSVLSGCAVPGSEAPHQGASRAIVLNLTATDPALSVVLRQVIVFQAPGSWKRDAQWDEYVFTLANYGSTPLVVTGAELFDFTGKASRFGLNPWSLEEHSRSDLDRLKAAAKHALKIGALPEARPAPVVDVGPDGTNPSVTTGPLTFWPFRLADPLQNSTERDWIEREFLRRRVPSPLTLAAGEVREGSYFFPLAPGPTHLVLHYRFPQGETGSLTLSLAPLARLHLTKPSQ